MADSSRRKSKRYTDASKSETQIFSEDDNWGDNTTAHTGATSDAGFSMDEDYSGMHTTMKVDGIRTPYVCGSLISTTLTLVMFTAVCCSPVTMVILPKAMSEMSSVWRLEACGAGCEAQIISGVCRTLVLVLGSWSLFYRRRSIQLPHIILYRSISKLFILLSSSAFWLFYMVRIFEPRLSVYNEIVSFASSYLDTLLFLHYLAIILIELRHLKSEYVIRVTRSPDGASCTYSCGELNVQRVAAYCLECYYRDFSIYNPYLETLTHATQKPTEFKFYNVDEVNEAGEQTGEINDNNVNDEASQTRAILTANARRRDAKHNDRFYEEQEYERRVKKRRARLLVATEEAFTHIRRKMDSQGPALNMEPDEAAQAIFPSMARALQKYLRVTRQQPHYSMDSVLLRLADSIAKDESPRAFLNLYLEQAPLLWNDNSTDPLQTWTLTSDISVNDPVRNGLQFTLSQTDVTLSIEIKSLPSLNILERTSVDSKFMLRLNSETSV